jgi:Ca2+-binding RTX toxin-like protein
VDSKPSPGRDYCKGIAEVDSRVSIGIGSASLMSHRRRTATLMITAALALAMVPAARADTGTFSNTTTIQIPDVGQAFPYPSDIAVTGLAGVVSDVNATLVNINHVNPDDIEALMVAPGGQTTVLMADAGGTINSVNDTIILDDSATFPVPDSGGLVNGATHKPADYEMPGLEPYNAPAPPPPHGLTLSTSNGSNPNGTWSLYVFDDFFNTAGQAISGGWSLTVTTSTAPGVVPPGFPPAICAGKPVTVGGTAGNDLLTGTAGADVIASGAGNDKITGLAGKDAVCAGDGKDTLNGGDGKDTLLGEKGKDTLKGGKRKDTLKGGKGNDKLKGGGAKDVCKGGKGKDTAAACEVEKSI